MIPIRHWLEDEEAASVSSRWFVKMNPATGDKLCEVTRGNEKDARETIAIAENAYTSWSYVPVIMRSEIIRETALIMRQRKDELAKLVALECGKPMRDALGEVNAAIECGFFFAGEGRRYFGQILTSVVPNRHVEMRREPAGVGVLITPFNNPAANVAWKLFPALLCGNAVILKAHEYIPGVPVWFAKIMKEAGLPSGVLSVLQGMGPEVGHALVSDNRVDFVSFTGSMKTGASILHSTAERLAKVAIEAGGKNPFVVCDDADLERASTMAVQAGFVDAGQRCVAGSRVIVFDAIYDEFKMMFFDRVSKLKVGVDDNDDYGALISEGRMAAILYAVDGAVRRGAKLLWGGGRLYGEKYGNGYFMAPTVLENVSPRDSISREELFGPVVTLYRARDFNDALALANNSPFGLGAAIHTRNIHRAQEFASRSRSGVVRVNGHTHGSEPHMPFGGMKLSGNGWREPGTNALDFYSEWKQVSIDHNPLRA